MNLPGDYEVRPSLCTLASSVLQLPIGNGSFDGGRDLPRFQVLGRAPTLRCLHGSAGRGQPYRADTGCRGPFPQSPRSKAPSAAGKWGCVRGKAGRWHGWRLGGAHLRGKEKAVVKGVRDLQDSFPPPPLACKGPREALDKADAQAPGQQCRHDSGHIRRSAGGGRGKAVL